MNKLKKLLLNYTGKQEQEDKLDTFFNKKIKKYKKSISNIGF